MAGCSSYNFNFQFPYWSICSAVNHHKLVTITFQSIVTCSSKKYAKQTFEIISSRASQPSSYDVRSFLHVCTFFLWTRNPFESDIMLMSVDALCTTSINLFSSRDVIIEMNAWWMRPKERNNSNGMMLICGIGYIISGLCCVRCEPQQVGFGSTTCVAPHQKAYGSLHMAPFLPVSYPISFPSNPLVSLARNPYSIQSPGPMNKLTLFVTNMFVVCPFPTAVHMVTCAPVPCRKSKRASYKHTRTHYLL